MPDLKTDKLSFQLIINQITLHNMTVYEAIEEMRRISNRGGEFSFTFMSYAQRRDHSHGTVTVNRARLRQRPPTNQNANAEIMEAYVDLDTGDAKQFYQPLVMLFNGQKTELT